MKTVTVKVWVWRQLAYAEKDGEKTVVRVFDPIARHYTIGHPLTAAQERYVIARTLGK